MQAQLTRPRPMLSQQCALPGQSCLTAPLHQRPRPHSFQHYSTHSPIVSQKYPQFQLQRSPRQRGVVTAAAAAAAAVVTSAGTATASFPALQGALAPLLPFMMAAAAACCAGLVLLMVVAPGAAITQRSVRSNVPLVLLAVAYGVVLLASWSSDTIHLMMPGSLEEGLKGGFNPQFFPTLESVQALFGRPFTAASFLLHVLAINLIAARSAFVNGVNARIPTTHSVLLSSVVGPLGLLSHQLTKAVYALLAAVTGRDLRPAAKPKVERMGPGTITIMPYDKQ